MSMGGPNQIESFLGDAVEVGAKALVYYLIGFLITIAIIINIASWVWAKVSIVYTYVINDPAAWSACKWTLGFFAFLIVLPILSAIFKFIFDSDVKPKYGTIRRYNGR